MKLLSALAISIACISLAYAAGQRPASCDPVGNVRFICGVMNAEDLIAVPQSDWVVASGIRAPGALYLLNRRDPGRVVVALPTDNLAVRFDKKTYDSCPGPLDFHTNTAQFRTHGLNIAPGANGVHTLYVVHHGSREAIEVFEIDARPAVPTLTWIGCAVAPADVTWNSVAPLSGGGMAATQFTSSADAMSVRIPNRLNTGGVWEWHTSSGWVKVPGGDQISGPNGIEVAGDGKWYYIGAWGNEQVIRLSRGQTPVVMDNAPVGFHVDNVRWAPDGTILAAGPRGTATAWIVDCLMKRDCSGSTSTIAKVNPQTLQYTILVSFPSQLDKFVGGTSALQVGNEIWSGQMLGDRIARYPLK